MATIPLPALHLNPPPQQENPLEQVGRLLALRQQMQNGPLQTQALQQQVQQGQIATQEAQQQQKDQQAFRAATQDPSMQGKTIGEVADALAQKGAISQASWQAAKKADTEHMTAIANLNEAQLKAAKAAHDQTQELYNNVMNLPDDQLQQNWPAIAQQFNSIPGQKQKLDPNQPLPKQQLAQFAPVISMGNAYLDQELARREKQATATKTGYDAAKAQYEAQQMAQNGGLTATQLETQNYHKQEIGVRSAQLGIENARLQFEKAKQGTQDQQAIESQAQQIANGDVKAPSLARNNPYNRALMARVYELNPKYSDSLYTATQDLRSSKPNSMGANVGRLGTAILHADRALDNSSNLGFSEGLLTGVATAGTSAYKQDAEFLTGEIGQYVTGGKLTVDEGRKLSTDLMSSRQSVRDSAIKEIINLSKGKLQSQMGQFKNATQTDFPIDRVFSDPDIKVSLQKHGVIGGASGGLSVTAPNGKVYTFKDQASADAFKAKAGIQ